MKRPFLLMIDGMTGAGKTTVSHLLSEHIPRVAVIGMDKVKRFVSDFERGTRDNSIARDVIFQMTKAYLDHEISVIIEQPIKSDSELQLYEGLAREHAIPIFKVQLFTDPKTAFQRVVSRQENFEIKVPIQRIRRNISLFERKEDRGFCVIDTTAQSSEAVKEKILKLLDDESIENN